MKRGRILVRKKYRRKRYGRGKPPYIGGNKVYLGGKIKRGKGIVGGVIKTLLPVAKKLLGL